MRQRNKLRRLACALFAVAALSVGPLAAQQVPTMPAPVAVSVPASTTAVLVMDLISRICSPQQPKCLAMLPHVATLVAAARKAGALVVYSAVAPSADGLVAPVASPPFVSEIAPQSGDPIVLGFAQDRFFATALDQLLVHHGITTLILAGWRENGSVLYTAVGANLHHYTVVVPDDATGATNDYDVAIGRYQLLTQLNSNPKNEPLLKGAVTLSRTDLITFR